MFGRTEESLRLGVNKRLFQHTGLATVAPGNGQILPAPAAIAEAIAGTGDADMAAAAAEPRDGLVDASEPASPGDR